MYFFNIETCVKILTAAGVGPQMKHGRWQTVVFTIHTITVAICLIVALLGAILTPNAITPREKIGSLEAIVTFVHFITKMTFAFLNKSSLFLLMKSTLNFWNPADLTCDSDKKELSTILKRLKYICIAFLVGTTLSLIGQFARPVITNRRTLVFEGYAPEDPLFYKIMVYLQSHATVFFASGVVAFDILFLTFILMAYSQIRMFNRGIGRIISVDISSPDERRAAKQSMRKYVEYHIFLLDFMRNLVETYSTILLQVILIWIFTTCVEMLNMTQTNSLSESSSSLLYFITLNTDVIAFYCIPSQLLIDEIENTRVCILNTDWSKNLMLFKTEILMILVASSKSKVIVAGKFVEINMTLVVSAFKTIVSYYMFVVNVSDK